MPEQSLVVAASSTAGPISVWDTANGSTVASFKDASCPTNSLALLGAECLLAAQRSSPAVHTHAWGQEGRVQRSFQQEAMTAVAASTDGTYIAAGGVSGSIYIWTAADGCLVMVWPAHFKAVTCLAFADDGAVLVSGAEDTLVCVWMLTDVLRLPTGPHADTTAAHTWSEHILPVTGLCIGAGVSEPIVATVSLDRNCIIHSLASGVLLRSMALPSLLHSVALDPSEHRIFLGLESGDIAQASLVEAAPSASELPGSYPALKGHVGPVQCLAVTPDGAMLASGAADGSVRLWDIASGQAMRVLAHPAKGPVTSLLCLPAPAVLSLPASDRSNHAPALMQQLAKFKQVAPAEAWCSPPATLGLDGSHLRQGGSERLDGRWSTQSQDASSTEDAIRQQLLKVQEQLSASQSEVRDWKALHHELHAFCVDKVLSSQ